MKDLPDRMKTESIEQPVRQSHGRMGMDRILKKVCAESHEAHRKCAWAESHGTQDVFGRLAPAADPIPDDKLDEFLAALLTISEAMVEDEDAAVDGPADAGIAFLGQFIDHDLTLDATTELGKVAGDVSKIRNFRTPRLDLDCVFGSGPEVTPHLYDQASLEGHRLLFGRTVFEGGGPMPNPRDLPRNRQGRALIGDPRNDENLFVSQVHGRMFIERFNAFFDERRDFEEAREAMIDWYHRTILRTFLPATVAGAVLEPFIEWANGGDAPVTGEVNWSRAPDMPVEFSAAAFRFGHSMIRQRYDVNDTFRDVPIFGRLLQGFSPVAEEHNLDLGFFFGFDARKSRAIDTKIPRALIELPPSVVGDGERNLAFRNMNRGQVTFRLPSGEAMAAFLGVEAVAPHPDISAAGLEGHTPLWFYILHEGEMSGGRLGPVGGSIVAGTLVNLILRTRHDLKMAREVGGEE